MFVWLIPYLVAYNATYSNNSSGGLEHVFAAEVIQEDKFNDHRPAQQLKYYVNFVCERMNFAVMQCRIDSANKKFNLTGVVSEDHNLRGTIFQIEFSAVGISKVWFLNNNRTVCRDMIRAIIETMSLGMDIRGKIIGTYFPREKSMIGTCNTTFTIRNAFPSEVEVLQDIEIEGYEFVVPSSSLQTDDKIIVITKSRDLDDCEIITPYFYGDYRQGLRSSVAHLESSEIFFYLGRRSFSALTSKSRTDRGISWDGLSSPGEIAQYEQVYVILQSIRPATNGDWITEDLLQAGAGFSPGTLWPEHGTDE